jgi:DNA repair exonuclease SbcCD nuclease subunit
MKNVPGVHVIHQDYRGIEIPEIDTTVFCLCHRALPGLVNLKLEPNPNSHYNVLTLHGTLEGIGRNFYDTLPPITRSGIMQDSWDYVALGHYHLHEKLGDNACYSGSLEYASFNIWEETERAKGFVEYDLDNHEYVDFHRIKARDVVDLRSVDADGLSSGELNQLVQMRIDGIKGGHQEKIVRLVVENVQRAIVPDLDYQTIRRIRAEALHFELQLRPKKKESIVRSAGDIRALPLEEEWREFARSYDVPAEINRDDLITTGLDYLGREI